MMDSKDGPKKIGLLIAGAMPPPGKLKRPGAPDDGGEGDDEEYSPTGNGAGALGAMWDALKAGDNKTAFKQFCQAMDFAKSEDSGSSESDDNATD